jgi:hypothetical protein
MSVYPGVRAGNRADALRLRALGAGYSQAMEKLVKILFIPFSVLGGIIAGLIGKKAFERVWGLVDDEEPPGPDHRHISWSRMLVALLLEGAIFKMVRGAVDRGARRGFERVTGTWPGEKEPEPT